MEIISAQLQWIPGNGISQEVQIKKRSDPSFYLYQSVDNTVENITIPAMEVNVLYDFRIVNKCAFSMETPSTTKSAAKILCPDLGAIQHSLSLELSFDHLGGDIDKYKVELLDSLGTTVLDEQVIEDFSSTPSFLFDGLQPDTYYTFRVVASIENDFRSPDCTLTVRTLGCTPDFTLAPDGSYCYKIEEIAVTPPTGGVPEITIAKSDTNYGQFGTCIYEPGFNVDGTGIFEMIPYNNAFWINYPQDEVSLGPLNRCGLWTTTTAEYQDIGFSVCLNISEAKTYYIGIGGDNSCKIFVNGQMVISQNPHALKYLHNTDTQVTFKLWHIYPILLNSGPNIIELIGHNDTSIAAMGAEVYDNTKQQLINATSYEDLNLVFSTSSMIGLPIQIGNAVGFTCPPSYSLATCSEPFVCRRIITTLPS